MDIADVAQVLATVLGVVLGVSVAEWLRRVRERRLHLESAVWDLAMLIPRVTLPLYDTSIDHSTESPWSQRNEDANRRLGEIRVHARWPLRRADRIRKEADDLAARLGGAFLRVAFDGQSLTRREMQNISADRLLKEVFPDIRNLDELTSYYRRQGLDSEEPRAEE